MLAQGGGSGPHDEVVDRGHPHPGAGELALELLAQREQVAHLGLVAVGELRHLLQAGVHVAGDRPAHAGQRDDVAGARPDRDGRGPGRGRSGRTRRATASTSARRIRPPGPLPRTWRRSTPPCAACRRTSGEAKPRRHGRRGGGAAPPRQPPPPQPRPQPAAAAGAAAGRRGRQPLAAPRPPRRPRRRCVRPDRCHAGRSARCRAPERPAWRWARRAAGRRSPTPPPARPAAARPRPRPPARPAGRPRGPRGVRRLLVADEQPGDECAGRERGALGGDERQPAVGLGLDVHVDLVRADPQQHVTGADDVAATWRPTRRWCLPPSSARAWAAGPPSPRLSPARAAGGSPRRCSRGPGRTRSPAPG